MKLYQTIQTKQTTKLFNHKYKYKIVLVSKAAGLFRGCNFESIDSNLRESQKDDQYDWIKRLTDEDLYYAGKLSNALKKCKEFEIRVENPYISFYTNVDKDIEALSKIDSERVKYVSMPATGTETALTEGKVIVKNIDFDYKVTMGRTRQEFTSFVEWCEGKDKIRMPKRAKKDLCRKSCWGGSHFYVKDEKMLTMVKMFVGGYIHSVELVVKQ
jgi:hypothetical protein